MTRTLVDSGIKWIGKIPQEWDVVKVNKLFYRRKEVNQAENPTILSLARTGVKIRDISTNEGQLAESYDNYHKVYIGDLMLNPMDLISGANCSISEVEGVISPAYINLAKKTEINSKYYDYFFKNQYWINAMFIHGKGVSFDNRWTMNAETIMDYKIPVPSIIEQNKIAEFLDKKCKKIDEIIKDNNKEIELLEEYNKNIFKDVISNYETKKYKLKYLLSKKLQYGANSSGIEYNENLPRYIRITDIVNNELKKDDMLSLTNEDAKGFILNDGDILFARSGGTVGKSFIFRKEYGNCAFAGYLIRAQFKDIELSKYVYNYTESILYEEWKNSIFIQSTIQNIGADKYSIMPIPVPTNKEEIKKINVEVDTLTKKINQIINYRKQIIEKLDEYKKSLIYEVVTGKKEV